MTNDQAERIAMALESIARSLVTIAHPPMVTPPTTVLVPDGFTTPESLRPGKVTYAEGYPVGLCEALRREPEA